MSRFQRMIEKVESIKSDLELCISHETCGSASEKETASRALKALSEVGWATPESGFGYNTGWAISELCKAVKFFSESKIALEIQNKNLNSLLDKQNNVN